MTATALKRSSRMSRVIVALGLTCTALATDPLSPSDLNSPERVQRSIVAEGDRARLNAVFAKAKRGEPVTLAFIGGSITEGAKATKPASRYVNLVVDWWRTTFPQA